jgi:hypothetical protein
MKNLYTALLLTTPLALSAQLRETRQFQDAPRTDHTKGIDFYSETFDNDLNGWTAETAVGVVDWKWTNEGPGPTSSTYPVPPLATSTPSGWAIIDDDFDGTGGQSTDASLISPVIDLSAAPANLRVRFEQYFQEFQLDATFVGVSVDGGSTWNEVEINAGVGREGRPNPEVIEVNISEWVSANPANVQLRFRYTSTWDYGWQVDNVSIVEQFQYDMIAVSSFLSHNARGEEYGRIPTSQLYPTMLVGGELKNDGSLEQTNVAATMTVRNSADEVAFSANSTIGTLAANTSAFMEEFATLPSLANDIYTSTLEVTSDQAASDANTGNNSKVRRFQVNDARYALDGIGIHPEGTTTVGSLGTNSFEGGEDGLVVMTYYEVREPLDVNGIEFLITANTVLGGYVTAAIYDTTDVLAATANFSNPVVESDAWDITEQDISSGSVSVFFPSPVTLAPGGYYAALTLNSNGGVGTIRVQDDLTVPQPTLASAIFIPADQVYTNGNALSVRLRTGSVPDQVQERTSLRMEVFPNPANEVLNIRIAEEGQHQVEVLDATGKLVRTSVLNGGATLSIADLARGIYTVRVQGPLGANTVRVTIQ